MSASFLVWTAAAAAVSQVYLFLHWCFCFTTFVISWLCWRHFWLHTVLVVGMGLISLWNGANFYFTVFAKRWVVDWGLVQGGAAGGGGLACVRVCVAPAWASVQTVRLTSAIMVKAVVLMCLQVPERVGAAAAAATWCRHAAAE